MAGRHYLGWALWLLGYPEQALAQNQEALRLGREISHAHSQAYALGFGAAHHHFRREQKQVRECGEALVALAAEQGLVYWLAWGKIMYGWALAEQGEAAAGIDEIRSGLDAHQSAEAAMCRTHHLCLLAEAYRKAGRHREALTALDEALALVEKNEDRWWEAEIHRLRGELLLLEGAAVVEAESCFQQAINVAHLQQAKSLELRATTSLARLRRQQSKPEEAPQMLAEIYGWFTEGFDTADLKDAKALLDELQP